MMWPPKPWSREQLRADADKSLHELNEAQQDPARRRAAYAQHFAEGIALFDELMERSNNLLSLNGASFNSDSGLVAMGRFTGGPLISNDDMERLVGRGLGNRIIPGELAESAARLVINLVDLQRFPWLARERQPSGEELRAAQVATATLWATQRSQTGERGEARLLEALVKDRLVAAGLTFLHGRLAGLPWSLAPGQFCGEGLINGTNCDVVAHLQRHEKVLLMECKISKTTINGTKRLKSIKEAAAVWRRGYGEQVLPVGVISGAFTLTDLESTQRDGVFIVWAHDLEPLAELVRQYGSL
jgi:hypothetical protein